MEQTVVQVDLADVKTVLQLEPKLLALIEAIKAAEPALDRLKAAKYAGAEEVREHLSDMIYNLKRSRRDGGVGCGAAISLERFRLASGDQGALDYLKLVLQDGFDIGSAMAELLDRDCDDLARVDGFREYARTVQP